MKSAIFVRPNLKLILVGALLIAVVQDLICNGHSAASILSKPASTPTTVSEADLQQLLSVAEEKPSAQVLMQISNCYQMRGDARKALKYLRRADTLAQVEELHE